MSEMARSRPRPALVYWTLPDGTIHRVEGQNADLIESGDELFTAPFTCANIIGRNLFEFIQGQEVSLIYRSLAARVFETGRTISFPYRCDSPGVRRDMMMKMSRENELVRYESVTIREISRQKEIPVETPGASTLVAICSFCKSYRFPVNSTRWKELESLLLERKLPARFRLSHGICDHCYHLAMAELGHGSTPI